MSIKTLKQALEALEVECRMYEATDPETGAPYNMIQAVTALRQAIEQAQKQEPVGEVEQIEIDDDGQASAWFKLHDHVELGDLLYTSPPQRQPLRIEFCITDMIDVGQYSLQLMFMSRKHADEFKAAHGIPGEKK